MAANEGSPKHASEKKDLKEHSSSASVASNEDDLFFSPVNKEWQEILHEAEGEESVVKADLLENTALIHEELNSASEDTERNSATKQPFAPAQAKVNSTDKLNDVNGKEYPADQLADSVSPADYYDLLGLSTSATTAEIVAAYRHRAREVADLSTSDPLYVNIKKVWLCSLLKKTEFNRFHLKFSLLRSLRSGL